MERRNTIQKELVLNAVNALHQHVTADEIYNFIKKEYPNISRGTVYRNLIVLVEENKVKRIEIPNGSDYYDYLLTKHYHVQCVKCKKVFDVSMDEVSNIESMITDKKGILFLDHDILFKGICLECQRKEKLNG